MRLGHLATTKTDFGLNVLLQPQNVSKAETQGRFSTNVQIVAGVPRFRIRVKKFVHKHCSVVSYLQVFEPSSTELLLYL